MDVWRESGAGAAASSLLSLSSGPIHDLKKDLGLFKTLTGRSKEKPKEKEKRISTMTEVQIMEKLRQVVSDDDPKQIYSKIKKVGQG